jgi:hypothetical protein
VTAAVREQTGNGTVAVTRASCPRHGIAVGCFETEDDDEDERDPTAAALR